MSGVQGQGAETVAPSGALAAAGITPGRRRRRSRGSLAMEAVYPVGFSVAMVVVWQLWVTLFDVSEHLVPAPTAVAGSLVENWSLILDNTWPTFWEIAVGFVIAAALGVAIAVVIAAVPIIEKMIYPILVGALVVPKIAIAPLFVIWFGFGFEPKVIVVVLIAFFPVVVDMALGLRSVPDDMITLVRSMGASRLKIFWKIRFVYALPNLFVGLKVAMALAVVGAIVGEFVQSSEGLGYLLIRANTNLDTEQFFAVLVVLTAMGVVFYLAVDVVERIVLRSRK
jgi:NitT/TauT family transport system permease protein